MGSLRVGHNWATSLSLFTFLHWRRKWQPTPVFLPGESQGLQSLVGCCLWGHTESDMNEVTWQAAITKSYRLCDLNSRNLFSQNSRGYKSKIKVPDNEILLRSLPGCQTVNHLPVVIPRGLFSEKEESGRRLHMLWCIFPFFYLQGHQISLIRAPFLWWHVIFMMTFNLYYCI